jgi:hypothetical protein
MELLNPLWGVWVHKYECALGESNGTISPSFVAHRMICGVIPVKAPELYISLKIPTG